MFFHADSKANAGVRLLREAQTSDDPKVLDQAIALLTEAVLSRRVTRPGSRTTNLCIAYHQRYDRDHDAADLDQAIRFGEEALAVHTRDDPDYPVNLTNLGTSYRRRYVLNGDLADLRRGIELGRRAVDGAAADDSNLNGYLSNLAISYNDLYDRTHELSDLHSAIELAGQAVEACPAGHEDRPGNLATHGACYMRLYERTGNPEDLERAIDLGEQSLAIAPPGRPRVKPLSDLCVAYRERFERAGSLADVDRAIELGEQAFVTLPVGHPRRTSPASNLNLAYRRRYEGTGDPADLNRAIEFGEFALANAAVGANSAVASYGSNLAIALQRRYQRTGVLADLDRAIELEEQAIAETPADHPRLSISQSNLSTAYSYRYRRTDALADLERAIELEQLALAGTPGDHPSRVISLSNLGTTHRERFEHTGEPADLEHAISFGHQALAAMPDDHAGRHMYLSNLHIAYQRMYDYTQNPADALRGIGFQEQALALIPDDHPGLAVHLSNLGEAHRVLSRRTGQSMEPAKLRVLTDRVVRTTTASPSAQVKALHIVGWLANDGGEHGIAARLLDTATTLLPSVPPRESGWVDQEHRLGEHSGLVSESVSAHCAINDPAGAVRTAELGRGVLLASQLDSRTDLTELHRAHPQLATEFRQISEQLAADLDVEDRRRLWASHDALLARIRQVPGFERFLLPPRLSDLQSAAADGAVVLVNAGRLRSDAIIVTAEQDPLHVPLPDLVPSDVDSRVAALLEATHGTGFGAALNRRHVLPDILAWLWDTVVAPVLDALPVRRVWWMPTGVLGLFPLHAAGHPDQPGALDSVVSSYTPTLRALAHTRTRPPATVRRQLTVAMQHTPGLSDLPGTAMEAAQLHAAHPGMPLLADDYATTDRVLAILPDVTWAHFACHATADPQSPSQSALRLHDNALSLPAISRLRLAHAELAYLSACSTAQLGVRHVDESLHLASAFQLAGFRHVIASLWPLSDVIAVNAARALYDRLPDSPTADHAATALHEVTRELRAEHPGRPDLWAPLVHSGP